MSVHLPAMPSQVDTVTRVKRLGAVATSLRMLALVLVAYVRVGWSRMETACAADPPGSRPWHSVHYSWSWNSVGFQCTYDDGRQALLSGSRPNTDRGIAGLSGGSETLSWFPIPMLRDDGAH
jgi:hypothetical protein